MTAPVPMSLRTATSAAAAVLALCCLSGCAEIGEASTDGYEPAKVEEVAGSGVKSVSLTAEAADRIDLRVQPARAGGRHTVVDYAALLYDPQGASWVYVPREPLTFIRTKVVVDRIDGSRVLLAAGLRPGTPVVTIGAAELYGAELGIAGGH